MSMGLNEMPFQFIMVVAMASVLVAVATRTLAVSLAKSGCPSYCGDVAIPYPFGTSPDCFLNENFRITCNDSFNPPKPFVRRGNIDFTNISIDGELLISNFVARDCFRKNEPEDQNQPELTLSDFTVSSTKNVFTVIGCDSYAYIHGYIDDQRYSSGCMSLCDSSKYVKDGSCIGSGCCQIEIPKGLSEINFRAYSFNNHVNVSDFNPCTYAFVVDKSSFTFQRSYLEMLPEEELPIVLEWAVTGEGNCTEAKSKSNYACKENSECYEPDNGFGYLCKCQKGYQGNPYLSNGCEDINECDDPNLNNCEQKCDNREGSYTCSCFKGYHLTDGGKDGQRCVPNVPNQFSVIKVALSVGIGFLVLVVSISWLYLVLKKRKHIKLKESFFQQNGGFLLKKELSKQTGSFDKAKFNIFTEEDLKKATGNFSEDGVVGRGGYGTVYRGFLTKDNPVAIKKSKIVDQSQIEQFINEIAVLSQIDHMNVVRLVGCCLETEVPLLVYEFVSNGTLFEHIHNKDKATSLSGERRLKIAAKTAGALSHLHSASTPIIHRDVKSANILLDNEFNAKISDFGASKLFPMNVTQLSTMVQGTIGYLDPEYFQTGQLTEKSDVYSFGVVLIELLTGKKPLLVEKPANEVSLVVYFLSSMEENRLFQILENHIVNDENKEQLREMAELARRCLSVKGEERPPMREVAMELEGLRRIQKHPWDSASIPEDTESLLFGTSEVHHSGDGKSITAGYDSIRAPVVALDVDAR